MNTSSNSEVPPECDQSRVEFHPRTVWIGDAITFTSSANETYAYDARVPAD